MIRIERKIIFYIFLIPIIATIVGVSGGVYLLNFYSKLSEAESEKVLKERELKLQKDKLKIIVDSVINNIIVFKKIDKSVIELLKEIYPPKNDKYIFIYKIHNINGGKKFATMLLNINRPDLEGKKIDDDYRDIKGFQFRKRMLELIKNRGEGFIFYYYKKPNSNKIVKKLSYFKYYKPLQIVVASGIYLDDLEAITCEYKKHLKEYNSLIIKRLILISILISGVVLFLTFLISRKIMGEFDRFRKTIALSEKKLKYKLYIDELTKLKSRKSLLESIEKRNFETLVLLDIDNFRNINQLFGSEIGDRYLIEFAKILKSLKKYLKISISIYRLGGDEFAITLKSKDRVEEIVSKIYHYIVSQKIVINDEKFDVDITLVYADFPTPLKKAILTLQEAKELNKSILSYAQLKNRDREK